VKDLSARSACSAADAGRLRVALVVSGYHDAVTGPLRDGAVAALTRAGVHGERVVVISVPGAFEIPFIAREAAATGEFDAVVCLGCVIRGETPHFDYIASAVAHGITAASQATRVPMTFGVLTTNSRDEALARAAPDETNKGWEAAMAAVQLAAVRQRLSRFRSTEPEQ
jgi:6,7-dimethyl-8-ribityllumazine synthase